MDQHLEEYAPDLYEAYYDTRLLAAKPPSPAEKASPIYNDYRERYGESSIPPLTGQPRHILLNGFRQEHFQAVAPTLKKTAEVLYFFKCPAIQDLSVLSEFAKLRCVHMYWNNTLENLWDMKGNRLLQAVSFVYVTKLRNIESLKDSTVEYVCLDSMDNSGNIGKMHFDPSVFEQMKHLKRLFLNDL